MNAKTVTKTLSNQPRFMSFGQQAVRDFTSGTKSMSKGEQEVVLALYYAHVEEAFQEIEETEGLEVDLTQMYIGPEAMGKNLYSERLWTILSTIFRVCHYDPEKETKNKWEVSPEYQLVDGGRAPAFQVLRQNVVKAFPSVSILIRHYNETGNHPVEISSKGTLKVPFHFLITDKQRTDLATRYELEEPAFNAMTMLGMQKVHGVRAAVKTMHAASREKLGMISGGGSSDRGLEATTLAGPMEKMEHFWSAQDHKVMGKLGKTVKRDALRTVYGILYAMAPAENPPEDETDNVAGFINWELAQILVNQAFVSDEEAPNGDLEEAKEEVEEEKAA